MLPNVGEVPRSLHEGEREKDCRRKDESDGDPIHFVDLRFDDAGLLTLGVLLLGAGDYFCRFFRCADGPFVHPDQSRLSKSFDENNFMYSNAHQIRSLLFFLFCEPFKTEISAAVCF